VARLILIVLLAATPAIAQELPQLTAPVNDFAAVIDPESEQALDALIRSLQQASGDVVAVATVPTIGGGYADLREYAVRLFENGGRGIGERGKDNGLLVVVAVQDRQVWVEVGYDLEEFITDGYAGETSRNFMVPAFRRGDYGAGLLAGVSRIVGRIADRRGVSLQGVQPNQEVEDEGDPDGMVILGFIILMLILNAIGRTRRQRFGRRWGGSGWSGWHSGVGPFGGGFGGRGGFGGGGFGGGGFGGGFGGFGGGRSGGGGGGAGW
jgi:uncharacterized protein